MYIYLFDIDVKIIKYNCQLNAWLKNALNWTRNMKLPKQENIYFAILLTMQMENQMKN